MKIFKLTLAALAIFATFSVAKTASAVTTSELIAAGFSAQEAAVIMQLFGGDSSGTCDSSYNHMGTLMVGSSGSQVMDMQEVLGITADGAFGPMTKAAVQAFQTEQGLVADGVVGAMTGAALEGANCDTDDEANDDNDDNNSDDDSDLSGGAGSVQSYNLDSSYNNEEVGEDEEDVIVAGLEMEADEGSDLEIKAVKLVFDEGTAASDFEDYASEVSIWMGDEEFARVDADSFNDENDWTRTISLDGGAIIGAEETENLYVAVSGISNLDTNDAADTWTVDFRSIRFMDGQGGLTNEDPSTSTRTFSFETFATAADVEMKVSLGDEDINDAHVIQVDATDDTNDVELLSFNVEADGDSDLAIDDIVVSVTSTETTGDDPADLVQTYTLLMDGEEVGSENSVDAGANSAETVTFDDLDLTIDAGEEVEFIVTADFNSIADSLDAGDLISVQISDTETDSWDVEDESGENLSDANKTGAADADSHTIYAEAFSFELVSVDSDVQTAADATVNDIGNFTFVYELTAFGGNVSINKACQQEDTADATADEGSEGEISNEGSSTVTCTATSTADTNPDDSSAWIIDEDETETFTLTFATSAITADHFAAMYLRAIEWDEDTADTSPDQQFTAGLGQDNTETDPVFLNFNA